MPRVGPGGIGAALADLVPWDQCPGRPCLRPEVLVRESADQVTIEGLSDPVMLRGQRTVDLLRRLLPLLDGRHDRSALGHLVGVSDRNVHQLLSVLTARGALQNGSSVLTGPTTTFLSRAVGRTGWHPDAAAARAALAEHVVVIPGDPDLAVGLSDRLGELVPVTSCDDASRESLIVLVNSTEVPTGRDCLIVTSTPHALAVGPFVDGARLACSECIAHTLHDIGFPMGRKELVSPGSSPLLVDVLAAELLNLLGGLDRCVTDTSMVRHDLHAFTTRWYDVIPHPKCPQHSEPEVDELVARYEASVALPRRRWIAPNVATAHFRADHLSAQHARPDLAGTPTRVPEHVHRMVRAAVGLRQGTPGSAPDRVAPSPGNLGSITASVVTGAQLLGYDAANDRFLRQVAFLATPENSPTIVLSADVGQLTKKYGAKSLRLAYLESGCALANLVVVAADDGRTLQVRDDIGTPAVASENHVLCTAITVPNTAAAPHVGHVRESAPTEQHRHRAPLRSIDRDAVWRELTTEIESARPSGHPSLAVTVPTLGVLPSAMCTRRSERSYGPGTVSMEPITEAINAADRAMRTCWQGDVLPRMSLLAGRIDDVPRGAVLRQNQGRLDVCRVVGAAWDELLLQPEFVDAAGVLIWHAPHAELAGAEYRRRLVQSGAGAGVTCLALNQNDIASCVLDAMLPGARHIANEPTDVLLLAAAFGPRQRRDE